MNYKECLEYIDDVTKKYGISPGLDNMNIMLDYYKRPEKKLSIVHLSGTNGKGSTAAYLASILKAAGFTVGRYISPCILDYREKIIIESSVEKRYITEDEVSKYISEIKEDIKYAFCNGGHPTPFEIETVMALRMFADNKTDYVILECGMGGELDATNAICGKEMCIFTSISLEHTRFLGNTLEEIAHNKAGIINCKCNVVSVNQRDSVNDIISTCASKYNCKYVKCDEPVNIKLSLEKTSFDYCDRKYETMLHAYYQPYNAVAAIEAAKILLSDKTNEEEKYDTISKGIMKAYWPGRFEIVSKNPCVVFDGAHNPAGIEAFVSGVKLLYPENEYRRIGIIGVFADKNIEKMADYIKNIFDELYTVTAKKPRGMDADALAERLEAYLWKKVTPCMDNDIISLINDVSGKKKDDRSEAFFVFGSLSLYELVKGGKVE